MRSNQDSQQAKQEMSSMTSLSVNERDAIMHLARAASIEMTVHDVPQLRAASGLLGSPLRAYVSHLPGQAWSDTVATCHAVHALGATPVPHVPVRCVRDRASLQRFLDDCVTGGGVREILLIAGDYPHSAGPYSSVMDLLNTGILAEHGIERLSVAGHPEGHPAVTPDELRRAEREKIEFALSNRLQLTFLTQFFFDAEPFIEWQRQLPLHRNDANAIRVVAGLAGPAKLTTLLRYAAICGVGPSIRALGSKSSLIGKMLTERGPESLVRNLVSAAGTGTFEAMGIHLFSFGGLTRTCAWLGAVANGRFELQGEQGFVVRDRE